MLYSIPDKYFGGKNSSFLKHLVFILKTVKMKVLYQTGFKNRFGMLLSK